ncbi:histidine phosphatase family protein [Anaerocolumna sp. AGMB13020]|uniref:histidine phosphatase family protein n=1 Tax=Anaerocolumna sp. AGMB13020 TaxID=3081750 RepID=UPI002953AFEE|nr:histidine phosphatase family protein [Anaerocolumna sp. AGMB13020]WOO37539.1 histidine phosphatase family protein [Anaerocolumna sp. AGMB13020]
MTLYLIRHGQTDWNVAGRIQGSHDSELNENGRKQAKKLGETILESQIQLSTIYTSPQKRAYKTAELIGSVTDKPVIPIKGLEEISHGLWEGLTWEEVKLKYPQEYGQWFENRRYAKAPGGESYDEMLKRVLSALHSITTTHKESAAVVTHGGVIMCLQCYLTDTPFDEMRKFKAKNTCILEIDSRQLFTNQHIR